MAQNELQFDQNILLWISRSLFLAVGLFVHITRNKIENSRFPAILEVTITAHEFVHRTADQM